MAFVLSEAYGCALQRHASISAGLESVRYSLCWTYRAYFSGSVKWFFWGLLSVCNQHWNIPLSVLLCKTHPSKRTKALIWPTSQLPSIVSKPGDQLSSWKDAILLNKIPKFLSFTQAFLSLANPNLIGWLYTISEDKCTQVLISSTSKPSHIYKAPGW